MLREFYIIKMKISEINTKNVFEKLAYFFVTFFLIWKYLEKFGKFLENL